MEKSTVPPLTGEQIDQDTFRRVWDRVMPDQTGSPIAVKQQEVSLPDTAVPGAETEEPEPTPEPDLPQVPACSGEESGTKPDCPCTGTPELCLGEASEGDSRRLEELMSMARRGMLAGRSLSCRAGGRCGRVLNTLTEDHRLALRRLSAAYFLIMGKRFRPCCPQAWILWWRWQMKKTASKATVIPTTQKRESTARTYSIMADHALMLQCIPART